MLELHELPATPLFAGVEGEDWPDLLGHSSRLDLAAGEAVFREGEDANAFFVMVAGVAEVRANIKGATTARILAHLGPGAVLGETSLFLGGQHSASVYAVEPSTVLKFGTDGFMEMIRSRHRGAIQILYNMGQTLAVRLRAADEQITTPAAGTGSPGVIANVDKARRVIPADYR